MLIFIINFVSPVMTSSQIFHFALNFWEILNNIYIYSN